MSAYKDVPGEALDLVHQMKLARAVDDLPLFPDERLVLKVNIENYARRWPDGRIVAFPKQETLVQKTGILRSKLNEDTLPGLDEETGFMERKRMANGYVVGDVARRQNGTWNTSAYIINEEAILANAVMPKADRLELQRVTLARRKAERKERNRVRNTDKADAPTVSEVRTRPDSGNRVRNTSATVSEKSLSPCPKNTERLVRSSDTKELTSTELSFTELMETALSADPRPREDIHNDRDEDSTSETRTENSQPSTDRKAPSARREGRDTELTIPPCPNIGQGQVSVPRPPRNMKATACYHENTRLLSGADREDLDLSAYSDVWHCFDCGKYIDELNRELRAKEVA